MNGPERLLGIAQQLDEFADEVPELLALSEELLAIADAWPEQRSSDSVDAEFQRMLESYMMRKIHSDPKWAQEIMYSKQRLEMHAHYSMPVHDVISPEKISRLFKGLNADV